MGSVFGVFWGSHQLSPFWGGVRPEGSIDPPPPPEPKPGSPSKENQNSVCYFCRIVV